MRKSCLRFASIRTFILPRSLQRVNGWGELRSDASPDEYAHLFWAILQGYIMQMFTSRSVCRELRITLPGREILYRIFLNE